MAKKILIVGGVACGPKAAARARRRDGDAEITILEQGPHVSYAGCGLPYYVGGVVPELRTLLTMGYGAVRDPAFFHAVKDVTVLIRHRATRIDPAHRRVVAQDLEAGAEKTFDYDRLVIATGATPARLSCPGADAGHDNVFNLWTLPDAERIRALIEAGRIQRVCVIGAGLIGLEAAEAFANQGLEVAIVEALPRVLAGALDPDLAELVHDALREAKIQLHLGEKVIRIEGEGNTARRLVTDHRTLETDALLVAVGARPNVALASAAGLGLGPTGAIAVDDHLRTSDPNIFAGGDCVENHHLVTGRPVWLPLGSTANLHGRVIGENLAGGDHRFPGVLGTSILKTLGVTVAATGISATRARELGYDPVAAVSPFSDKSHYYPGAKSIAIKVVADRKTGRVLGVQAVGPGDVARVIDAAAAALRFQATLDDLGGLDFAYAPPYGVPIEPLATTANICRNVRDGLANPIPVARLHELLAGDRDFLVLDIRSAAELKKLPPIDDPRVKTIDLLEVRARIAELDPRRPTIVICQAGLRAYDVQRLLTLRGFADASYLEGGMSVYLRTKKT